jgi:hypothetical protein
VDLVGALEPADALLEAADAPHRPKDAQGVGELGGQRSYAATVGEPTTSRTAPAIFASSGSTAASSGAL